MFKPLWKGWKILAIFWLLIITVLFFLPGSALPKESWLDKIYFDKIVHFGFFAILVFLWRFYLPDKKQYSVILFALAGLYGFGVEIIQHYFISNRSFDFGDVVADSSGAVIGIIFWGWYVKK